MQQFLAVCMGGALGTGARYLVMRWAVAAVGPLLPLGTWLVNIAGSFAMGMLSELSLTLPFSSPTTRLMLTTGVLGGFTTYSSFNQEVLQAFHAGAAVRGIAYLLLMTLSCLTAGAAGLLLARRFV